MRIVIETEIEAPAELVFDYIADLTNNPEWQSGVAETKWTSPLPVVVGTTCEQRLDNGGVVGYGVVAIDPGKSITIETLAGTPVPATITRNVQQLDDARSRVHMDLAARLPGWRVVITPMVRWLFRREIRADYRRLKKLLETAGEPPGE
jgi:uncharacterized membrane protein